MAAAAMKLRSWRCEKAGIHRTEPPCGTVGQRVPVYFPAAKIKVVEKGSLTAKNRKIFANQIATATSTP
jgi:hypothetical protein